MKNITTQINQKRLIKHRLEKYVEETETNQTVDDMVNSMYFEDIQRDGISIGMFGWSDPLTTQGHGKSITIRMVYIEPDYRGNFNEIVKHIMEVCKKAEVETIQMYATKEVSNWFRRLGYDPKGYLHIYKPQEILNSLSAENQEVA